MLTLESNITRNLTERHAESAKLTGDYDKQSTHSGGIAHNGDRRMVSGHNRNLLHQNIGY